MWHKALSLVTSSHLQEYLLNVWLLTAITPLALFFLFLKLNAAPLSAVLLSWPLLTSFSNSLECPKVNVFAVLMQIVTILTSLSLESPSARLRVLCLGLFATAYVRPELTYAAITFFALCVYWEQENLLSVRWLHVVLACTLLTVAFGFPLQERGYNRELATFGPSLVKSLDVWQSKQSNIYEEEVWQQALRFHFGEIQGIFGALLANPRVFAKHLLTKLNDVPSAFEMSLRANQSLNALPPKRFTGFVLLLFGLVTLVYTGRKSARVKENILRFKHELAFLCLSLACALSPIIVAVLYPRHLYSIVVLSLIMAALLFAPFAKEERRPLVAPATAGLFLVLTLITKASPSFLENRNALQELNALYAARNNLIWSCPGYLADYIGSGRESVHLSGPVKVLVENNVRFVVLKDCPRLTDKTVRETFIKGLIEHGFVPISEKDAPYQAFFRKG